MNKYTLVGFFAFIVSAIYTILLMISGVNPGLDTYLAMSMAGVLEFCKAFFMVEAFKNNAKNNILKLILFSIAMLLLAYSIFASTGRMINQNNVRHNKQIMASEGYSRYQKQNALNEELLSSYQVERKLILDNYTIDKNSITQSIDDQVKKLNEYKEIANFDYYSVKRADGQIQELIKDKQDAIKELTDEKNESIKDLDAKIDACVTKLERPAIIGFNVLADEDGYGSFFTFASTLLGVDTNTFEFWFFFGLCVLFEIATVLCVYLSTITPKWNLNRLARVKVATRFQKGDDVEEKLKEKLREQIDENNLKAYRTEMLKTVNKETKIVAGYQKIAEATGITQEEARKIRSYLELIGEIKTHGKLTKLV